MPFMKCGIQNRRLIDYVFDSYGLVYREFIDSKFINHGLVNCRINFRLHDCGMDCVLVNSILFEVLQRDLTHDNISPRVF